MPTPATSLNLIEFIEKSGLMDKGRLKQYLASVEGSEEFTPQDLAERMVTDGLLTDFQAKHLLKGRYRNFFIGKFKVLQPLGSGGMSQVYLCEHAVMKHRVAMKLLPIRETEDKAAVGRFMREARAAAAVNHPNVVRAHDFDLAEKKFYYLIMDYVDGINLHDLVKKVGPLPPAIAANFISQAAQGLQHIHECGLIHRDLKPSNLLIDRTGTIRILDLGLARFTDDDKDNLTRQFQGKSILGTADFLAPEQAIQSDNIDIRADIYSLGATLYFLLSGRAPFESQSVTQKLLAHQIREPDPIPDCPDDLQEICKTMMQKQADDRYGSPNEVVAALSDYSQETPSQPPEEWFSAKSSSSATGMSTNTASYQNQTTPTRLPAPSSRPAPISNKISMAPPSSRGGSSPPPSSRGGGPKSTRSAAARMASFDPMAEPIDEKPSVKTGTKKIGIFAGLAVGIVALGGVIGWAVFGGKGQDPVVSNTTTNNTKANSNTADLKPSTAETPKGAIVVGPTGVATLADALKQANPGDRIVVTAAKLEEAAVLNVKAKGVTIEGWPENRQVLWTVPAGHDAGRPLIQISNVEGVRLKNFQFDGKQSVDTIIGLTGNCTGVNLTGLKIFGFRTAGVDLTAASGSLDRPLRFDGCRWLGSTVQASAIRVSRPTNGEAVTKGVTIANCRFEGTEAGKFGTGLRISAPIDEFEVRSNRFFKMTRGIHYAVKSGSDQAVFQTTVLGNCFFELNTAFLFDSVPTTGSNLNLFDNLFLRTEVMASTVGVDGRPNCNPGEWICHAADVKRKENGQLAGGQIAPGKRYFRKTFELKDLSKDALVMDISAASSFKVWLNGDPIGESRYEYYDKRVWSFPMAGKLKVGPNVIAVEVGHIADKVNPGYQSSSGLMVRIGTEDRDDKVVLTTDGSWSSSAIPAAGWEKLMFNEVNWKKVHVWTDELKVVWPWVGAVWDTAVRAKLAGQQPLPINSTGNFRDYTSNEGFPLLSSARGFVNSDPKNFPQDPDDDTSFLRIPRGHSLNKLGTEGRPVGVPMKE